MKNKGFTLVEVIAVVALLAIILIIAVPKIQDVVTINQYKTFLVNQQMLEAAGKNYFMANKNLLPASVGQTNEVSITTLNNEKYLDSIRDPANRSITCAGYVTVTKISALDYTYTPHLKCGAENSIVSRATDSLVVNYGFNDAAKTATNILTNPLTFSWNTYSNATNGWSHTKETLPSDYDNEGTMTKVAITKGTVSSASDMQIFSGNLSIVSGKTYTYSFYAKALVGRSIHLSMIQNGTPYTTYVTGAKTVEVGKVWKRYDVLFTATATAADARIQMSTGMELYNDELYIYKPQLELGVLSPFVNGSRVETVKDNSGSGKTCTLVLDNAPGWNAQGASSSGNYIFDGSNDYILSDTTTTVSGNQTFMAWVNPRINKGLTGIVSLHNHSTTSNFGLNLIDGKVAISIGYTDATREYNVKLSNGTVPLNQWTHIAATFNSATNRIRFYINGAFDREFTVSKTVKYTAEKVLIGQWAISALNSYVFDGKIDDVRIYNRVISDNEMAIIYNVNK